MSLLGSSIYWNLLGNEQTPNHERRLTSCPPKSTQLSFELTDLLVMLAYISLAYHNDHDGHTFMGL